MTSPFFADNYRHGENESQSASVTGTIFLSSLSKFAHFVIPQRPKQHEQTLMQ